MNNYIVKKITKKQLKKCISNIELLPNMTFEFYRNWNNTIFRKLKANKQLIYCLFEELQPKAMLLLERTKNNELCSTNLLDYFDIIQLSEINSNETKLFIKEILKKENLNEIIFYNCRQDSILFQVFAEVKKFKIDTCVKINIGGSYEEYYLGLSKSSRQNIRTAYNRMNTDGKIFDFVYSENPKEIKKYKSAMKRIYVNRTKEKNNLGIIKKWFYREFEPLVESMVKTPNLTWGGVFINKKLAGYYLGLRNDNEIMIPRLSIDIKYARYSVGNLLINETIKYLINNKNYKIFDLAQGNEPYKYVMGGVEHFKYNFKIGDGDL